MYECIQNVYVGVMERGEERRERRRKDGWIDEWMDGVRDGGIGSIEINQM